MRLFQAALDTLSTAPFSATLSVHGLHFTVCALSNCVTKHMPNFQVNFLVRFASKPLARGLLGIWGWGEGAPRPRLPLLINHVCDNFHPHGKFPRFSLAFAFVIIMLDTHKPQQQALVAHDCGYPLSRYTCRATRVAATFLDFIAFCRCSTGVALHPLKILVSHPPPPCAGRCRTEIWV